MAIYRLLKPVRLETDPYQSISNSQRCRLRWN